MISRIVFIIFLSFILGACGTTTETSESTNVEDRSSTGSSAGSSSSSTRSFGAGNNSTTNINALDDPTSPLSVRVIYFEYDSSEVLPAYREVLEAHSSYLVQNPNMTMSLEGHADERGSREYNLALGERRSQSTKRLMMLLGPTSSQIRTTSYGEERPVADGHDEGSWSQNRRVEIIYPR
jgi:peptidoglycan-associated lipoprotein